jgi:excisionase family DNA binding protein
MAGFSGHDFGPEFGDVLDRFLDRLAAELADRVERRMDRLASAQQTGAALNVRQAAARLGVSERKMRELVMSHQIPSVKVGRRRLISATAVERLLADDEGRAAGELHVDDSRRSRLRRAK